MSIRHKMKEIMEKLQKNTLEEINIRINRPIILRISDIDGRREVLIDYNVTEEFIKETLGYISNFSMYAYEEEVREGFLTIRGGHRIGISGKTVMDGNVVKTIKNITSLNIRIARQVKGCADEVMDIIMKPAFENTLIISPPCMGKTTLLREMVRMLSDEYGYKLGLVDERGEIAACHMGVPQNDIGIRCDVMDGCRKDIGLMMLIRSMSPEIIAVDELGGREDIEAVRLAGSYGGKVLCTIHGDSLATVGNKRYLKELMDEKLFKYYIIIGRNRTARIFDGNGKCYDKVCRLYNNNTWDNNDGL